MNINAIKAVDKYLGAPLCIVLGILNKIYPFKKLKEPKKILVIQLWGIGETILTLPAIKQLKQSFPDAELTVLTTNRVIDVFTGLSYIDKIIQLKINPLTIAQFSLFNMRSYDLVIDFEEYLNISSLMSFVLGKYRIGYNNRPRGLLASKSVKYNDKQHVVETHLDLIRKINIVKPVTELEKLSYSEKDKHFVDNYLENNNIAKDDILIGLCPGAAESSKSRMWALHNYAQLADLLIAERNTKIILIGNNKERPVMKTIAQAITNKSNVLNSAGHLSLKQLFYLEERCNLIISNDSGPMHISAAMGTKTIGLFGPNLPIRWKPFGKNGASIYKGDICKFSPCINVHKGKVPECLQPNHDNICMKEIKVEDVLRKIHSILPYSSK